MGLGQRSYKSYILHDSDDTILEVVKAHSI